MASAHDVPTPAMTATAPVMRAIGSSNVSSAQDIAQSTAQANQLTPSQCSVAPRQLRRNRPCANADSQPPGS